MNVFALKLRVTPSRALLAVIATTVGVVFVLSGQARSGTPDPLTPEYAALGHVTIDPPGTAVSATAISSEMATAIAQKEVGDGVPVRSIHHGLGSTGLNTPVRPVWIVAFTGVSVPVAGPSGAALPAVLPSIVTGVIVDDDTGEVLAVFHISNPNP